VRTTIDAAVGGAGEAIVHGRVLEGFIKSVAGAVDLAVDQDRQLHAECGAATIVLRLMERDQWPLFSEAEGDEVEITAHWPAIARILHAQGPTNETSPTYMSVIFDGDDIVCASRVRLATHTVPGLGSDMMVPAAFLSLVDKALPAKSQIMLRSDPRRVTITVGDTAWTSSSFPDAAKPPWRDFVRDRSDFDLTIDRQALLRSLSRLAVLPDESGFRRTTLTRTGDEVELRSTGADIGTITDVLPCSGSYEGAEIKVRTDHLRELAEHANTDEITFGIVDPWKHLQLDEDGYTELLMVLQPSNAATVSKS
jgi:DNA polymerase III sliding clamp (beta) subunit (PCNA family)